MTPDLEHIPPELKGLPQWVSWSLEEREGKSTKIPKNPKTGGNAMANDPGTWGEFDLAVGHWEAHRNNGIAGVGFQFSTNDPFTGIDLDKCRNLESAEIEPWALEIVGHLNSYTEVSPSGTGLHIWIKGDLPPGGRRRKGKIEMYNSGRYFTVTGHHLEDTPTTIEDRQAELEALHGEVFGKPSEEPKQGAGQSTKAPQGGPVKLADDKLIDRISKSKVGNKFSELWRGDMDYLRSYYHYSSPSEADLALCSILAFWTRKDPEAMDHLFRRSNLMRPKWDEHRGEQTYGERTIAKAIADTPEGWKGGRKKPKENKGKINAYRNASAASTNLIDDLNNKHAVIMIGGKCLIMNEVIDPVFNRPDVTFSSTNDFKTRYSNIKIMVPQEEGMSETALSKLWLESPRRRQYDGIVFSPGKDVPGFYNLYKGFAVTPVKGDWSLYRHLMKEVIAAGDEENFNYLLKWMARLVQDPGGERPGVSVVMRGKMGVGKGVFTTQYGEILGSHFLHITNPTHLVHRFNNHLKDCLLCFVDEGIWAGDKQAEGILKGMITEKHIMVEPKGKDAFPVKNHIHLIFASNNSWVVPAGLEERRFFVLDVSDQHMQDHQYFAAILSQMNNGGREALLYDLLELNVSDLDLRKIPRTNALLDQIIHTMPSAHKFWLERLRAGTLLKGHDMWMESVITEDLYNEYLDFAQAIGDRYRLIDRQFSRELRRLCPDIKRGRRTIGGRDRWVLYFPALDTCREQFEQAVRHKINWRGGLGRG